MSIIASGVETVELYDELRESGVHAVQGEIFAYSLPLAKVEEELAKGSWQIKPVTALNRRARRRTVYRKIQVINEDHSYEVTLRNLSKTGALIEGLEVSSEIWIFDSASCLRNALLRRFSHNLHSIVADTGRQGR